MHDRRPEVSALRGSRALISLFTLAAVQTRGERVVPPSRGRLGRISGVKAGLALALVTFCSGLAAEVVVESRLSHGSLRFDEVVGAIEYRVEWAGTAEGPWYSFYSHDVSGLDAIAPSGTGLITALVPLVYRVVATMPGSPLPENMALVAGSSFLQGDSFTEGGTAERPVHSVYVSDFYVDQYEVTKALWDQVHSWAVTNGYTFDSMGAGKSADYPVHSVNWYDAVKWCNARSEMEGRAPSYYTSTTFRADNVYRAGRVDLSNEWVRWAGGYRLPTESEWEKAARGGVNGSRFPWSDVNTIQHGRANYYSTNTIPYDTSPTRGFHPAYGSGAHPDTNPAGSLPANGYGLYDMAGNVDEWCWDRYSITYYSTSPPLDPRGPDSGAHRALRGGGADDWASSCRVARRGSASPNLTKSTRGFRVVMAPIPSGQDGEKEGIVRFWHDGE